MPRSVEAISSAVVGSVGFGRLQGYVRHSLNGNVQGRVRKGAAVGPSETVCLGHPAVELVPDEHAVAHDVEHLGGYSFVVVSHGRKAMGSVAVSRSHS